MSKLKLNSILFIHEMIGDSTDLFFIPDGLQIPKEVRQALIAARNILVNSDELTDKQEAAYNILNAAMATEQGAEYLDDAVRQFQGVLLPFKLTDEKSLQTSSKLNIVRCGFVM